MCGLFGFYSKHGHTPNMTTLADVGLIAEERGRHAHGVIWRENGVLRHEKHVGRLSRRLETLDATTNATAVVGHTRHATTGDPRVNANNQPLKVGGFVFAHNGVITNYKAILARFDIRPDTECDSEVIGHLFRRAGGSIENRFRYAMSIVKPNATGIAVMAMIGDKMLIYRDGKPLSVTVYEEGAYFCSYQLDDHSVDYPDGELAILPIREAVEVFGVNDRREMVA